MECSNVTEINYIKDEMASPKVLLIWRRKILDNLFYPSSHNGLIVLTGEENFGTFLLIFITEGRVSFTLDNLGSQQATSMGRYDDSELHTLQFTFIRGDVFFVVDGREQPVITGFPGT